MKKVHFSLDFLQIWYMAFHVGIAVFNGHSDRIHLICFQYNMEVLNEPVQIRQADIASIYNNNILSVSVSVSDCLDTYFMFLVRVARNSTKKTCHYGFKSSLLPLDKTLSLYQ